MRWQDVPRLSADSRRVITRRRNLARRQNAPRPRRSKRLREFWRDVENGSARLGLLREMSVVVEPFMAGWTLERRRKEYILRYRSLPAGAKCFVCYDKATEQHHVVLLKHGGTNEPRNRVPICRFCHEHIHDWMDATETVKRIEAEMDREDQHYRELTLAGRG